MSKGVKELDVHDGLEAFDEAKTPEPSAPKKRRAPRQPLSALSKTSLVVLLVLAILMGGFGLFIHQTIVIAMSGIMLLFAALIMTGIRWTPILASVMGSLVLLVFTVVSEYPLYHLSHPKDVYGAGVLTWLSFLMFIVMVTLFWCSAMTVITGIAAVVQNYAQRVRRTPGWFKTALGVAIGVLFGAVLLGSLMQPAAVTASANATPTVHLGAGAFAQSSITISKGSKLILVDDGAFHHNISTGSWVNGQPDYSNQAGAPSVTNQDINAAGASLTIGPFTTAGTYHIFCSIHEGMTLTIIVQ